jgi:hypothetical protein
MFFNNGPHLTEQKALKYKYKKQEREIYVAYHQEQQSGKDHFECERSFKVASITAKANFDIALALLQINQKEEVFKSGVDPDADAKARRTVRLAAQREARMLRWNEWRHRMQAEAMADFEQQIQPPGVGLQGFANDRQNIHTTAAVNQTKANIKKILKIDVPEGYRWNPEVCSKTPFDIGLVCNLTPDAAKQMTSFYTSGESIYGMEEGIYGKTLDSVWQFIRNSDDKECLQKILKVEMQDNIGMCAQGNLSRIANILSGYIDGIKVHQPIHEVLGRLLPALIDIEDDAERLQKLMAIFATENVPKDVWITWATPLFDNPVEIQGDTLVVH